MQDNMYDSIVEIIENAFNLEKYKSFDCMLQRGGLFYLVKCIVKFKKNGKDLAELDKINMRNYFCTINIFRESHFVQYLLNKISFNEMCFYYDMPSLNNRPLAKVKKQSDVSIDFIKFINSKIIENGTYARGLIFPIET